MMASRLTRRRGRHPASFKQLRVRWGNDSQRIKTPAPPRSPRRRTGSPALLAQLPDVLGGPPAAPFELGLCAVGGRGAHRGPELDQVLDREPVPAEQPDPLPVRQLVLDVR